MVKIKRKQKQRKVIKRNKDKNLLTQLTDDQLNSIPPHLLDKIPPSMSLRPNAQNLRAMMMQRLAPPFMQMPMMTPQQQQAQNLKNTNDIKEQAINQAKQDLIVENDRKRNLLKQQKDLKYDKQQMQQQMDYEKQLHQVKLEQEQLDFKKQLLKKENRIMTKKSELEETMALVEQAKFENQKMKQKMDSDNVSRKIESLKNELKIIQQENNGLLAAIEKMNSSEQLEQLQNLYQQVAENQAKSMIYKRLTDMNNQYLQAHLENQCKVSQEMIEAELKSSADIIKQYQESIAKEMSANQNYQHDLKRIEFIQHAKDENMIEHEKLKLENQGLEQKTKLFSDKKIRKQLDKLTEERIGAQMTKDYLEQRLSHVISLNETLNETAKFQSTINYFNDEQYKSNMFEISKLQQLAGQIRLQNKIMADVIESQHEALKAEANAEAMGIVHDKTLQGQDVVEALKSAIRTLSDKNLLNLHRENAAHQQLALQHQTSNQVLDEHTQLVNELRDIYNSEGVNKETITEFLVKTTGQNDIEKIVELPNSTLREFLGRFGTLRSTRMNQADDIIANGGDDGYLT